MRLISPPNEGQVGEIEHVLSGERRRFSSGAELLSALQGLQRDLADAVSTTAGSAVVPHR
ncbi:hypothetical protein ENE75_02560 [Rubrivivax albus]|uniref:Uncharacterized protein n=1 Tax=Rubrivivax albus TaxID=2499835 RepID=A0A437K0D0_9BURK|nr:hypothetical protein ENE75_02560 [Rubrivivax albus]